MPADRAKVLAALNVKFRGKSVDKNYKEEIATKWAAKIADDDGIDDFIEDREDDVLVYMKAKDAAVSAATAKAKEEAAAAVKGDKKPADEPAQPELPDDTPPWAKVLFKKNEALEAKLAGFEAAKAHETIEQRFLSHESVKKIPPNIAKRYVPKTEAELESAITELTNDFAGIAPAAPAKPGFGRDLPGGAGQTKVAEPNGKVDPAIKAFAEQKSKEFQTQKQ